MQNCSIESIVVNFATFTTIFVNLFAFLFLITLVLIRVYIIYILYSILSNSMILGLIFSFFIECMQS